MINWRVRIKNKLFWVTIIPLVLLLISQAAAVFGVTMNLEGLEEQLIAIVGTVFAILGVLGVVMDPTTSGVGDSDRAMGYEKPWSDEIVIPKHARG